MNRLYLRLRNAPRDRGRRGGLGHDAALHVQSLTERQR